MSSNRAEHAPDAGKLSPRQFSIRELVGLVFGIALILALCRLDQVVAWTVVPCVLVLGFAYWVFRRHGWSPAIVVVSLGIPAAVIVMPEIRDFIARWYTARFIHRYSLDVMQCLSGKPRFPGVTNYVAVVGPGTAWPGSTSESLDHIESKDGRSTTILLVEVANSNIHWAEPRDLTLADIQQGFNPKQGLGISSRHPNVVNVSFCDGRTLALSTSLPQATLQALLTVAGKEPLPEDDVPFDQH